MPAKLKSCSDRKAALAAASLLSLPVIVEQRRIVPRLTPSHTISHCMGLCSPFQCALVSLALLMSDHSEIGD